MAADRHSANTLSLDHPVPEHVGVQAIGQRQRRDQHAGLPAGPNDLGLELGAVSAVCSPSRRFDSNRSVRVSTLT